MLKFKVNGVEFSLPDSVKSFVLEDEAPDTTTAHKKQSHGDTKQPEHKEEQGSLWVKEKRKRKYCPRMNYQSVMYNGKRFYQLAHLAGRFKTTTDALYSACYRGSIQGAFKWDFDEQKAVPKDKPGRWVAGLQETEEYIKRNARS